MPILGFFVRAMIRCQYIGGRMRVKTSHVIWKRLRQRESYLHQAAPLEFARRACRTTSRACGPSRRGAARIALGAVATGEALDLQIVPPVFACTFQDIVSQGVLLYCGKPFPVPRTELNLTESAPARLCGNCQIRSRWRLASNVRRRARRGVTHRGPGGANFFGSVRMRVTTA